MHVYPAYISHLKPIQHGLSLGEVVLLKKKHMEEVISLS